MAAVDGFTLADADVPAVLEICRRLDGIPLALELAAARVGVFSVRELAAHLDDRFRLLTSGRRTALPRHQTLGAVLDWSYQLLPEEERAVLRRLSVFAGEFPLEAAVAVAADPGSSEIVDHIAEPRRQIADRRRSSRRSCSVSPSRHHAPLRPREAEELGRTSTNRPPSRRIFLAHVRARRSRKRVTAAGRVAGHLRPASRQCARRPRLGIFSGG